jgi:predicted RNA-binding protein (virulence factor B family)
MEIGEIDFLKATAVTGAGAFLKLPNEEIVTLPKFEQLGPIEVGKEYLVILFQDRVTYVTYASERIDDNLMERADERDFKIGSEVSGTIYGFTPLGAKVAINRTHKAFIFDNDIHQEISIGETLTFFIKEIRPDGKIGLSLRKAGYRGFIDTSTEQILNALKEAGGELPFNDKSSPEDISHQFKMSKKVFKETIGKLYKLRQIVITDTGIKLSDTNK